MSDTRQKIDSRAIQFMIVDFLGELLHFSDSPRDMAQYLTRMLRELMGARLVVMLQHGSGSSEGAPRILAIEPAKAQGPTLVHDLARIVGLDAHPKRASLILRAFATPAMAEVMDRMGIASVSLAPLWVGALRVGTLISADYLDHEFPRDIVPLLDALAPVFALILRNALQFESQETKVLAAAEAYQAILRTTHDGHLVVGGDGRILDANERYLQMSGYDLEELLAMGIHDLEAAESPRDIVQRTDKIKSQGSDLFITQHVRKDRTLLALEVSTTYVRGQDRFLSFYRDLTDKLAAEKALQSSEAHHREVLRILGEGVTLVDETGRFILANPEAEHIFGSPAMGLVGRNLRAFLGEDEQGKVDFHRDRRKQGLTDAYQLQIRREDGSLRTLQVSATPSVDEHGQYLGGLAAFRDVTDELKTQDALRLAQKMESLGSLAGGVAHDMNNVLGAILGLASAHLGLHPKDSPAYQAFETIQDASLRGGAMVKRLLAFARQSPIENRELDLNALLLEQARLLEHTTLAKVRLDMQLAPDLGLIHGDASALSHTFMNLCVNAVDAMGEGGTLTFRTRNLEDGQVEVVIADTGCGMAQDVLVKALDPFFTTKDVGKGTGLGLSMAYSTVKAHGGQLQIQSAPAKGTQVGIVFPAAANRAPAPVAPAPAQPLAPAHALGILVVDDDELIRKSTLMLVELLGHEATAAASGEEALALLEQGARPDLVILDMNMPGLGGKGTLPRLRALRPQVPVLLATGRTDQEAMLLVEGHPRVHLLPKPYSIQELQAALEQVVGPTP